MSPYYFCRTPLVRLNKLSKETGCEILVKAEMANGGGSVKDRAALFLIKDSEEKGMLIYCSFSIQVDIPVKTKLNS